MKLATTPNRRRLWGLRARLIRSGRHAEAEVLRYRVNADELTEHLEKIGPDLRAWLETDPRPEEIRAALFAVADFADQIATIEHERQERRAARVAEQPHDGVQ